MSPCPLLHLPHVRVHHLSTYSLLQSLSQEEISWRPLLEEDTSRHHHHHLHQGKEEEGRQQRAGIHQRQLSILALVVFTALTSCSLALTPRLSASSLGHLLCTRYTPVFGYPSDYTSHPHAHTIWSVFHLTTSHSYHIQSNVCPIVCLPAVTLSKSNPRHPHTPYTCLSVICLTAPLPP